MSDLCNHSSVGIIVERDGRFLLFQRQKFPIAKAPAAGHVDEYDGIPIGSASEERTFRDAGVRELEEETGLRVRPGLMKLVLTMTMSNVCRRKTIDGTRHWHLWRVYWVRVDSGQEPRGNADESADLAWYTASEIDALPDLEQVWRTMLKQIGVI